MKAFELLGGKYQQGEQILPGLIQTFRSYEVPTGRPVFIHRIPLNDPAAGEIAGLLSEGLIRSPAVRKMLVDVYENEPYRFVVTEPARQCVPLRDWLERESEHASEAAPSIEVPAERPPAPERPRAPLPGPLEKLRAPREAPLLPEPFDPEEFGELEPPPDAEASEFARLFQAALSGKMERSRRNALQENPPSAAQTKLSPQEEPEDFEEEPDEVEPPFRSPVQPRMTRVPSEAAPSAQARAGEPEPAVKVEPPAEPPPVATAAPSPPVEPELFSQVGQGQDAGRSTLIIFLVVLGVLVVLLVMFVVVFVKR